MRKNHNNIEKVISLYRDKHLSASEIHGITNLSIPYIYSILSKVKKKPTVDFSNDVGITAVLTFANNTTIDEAENFCRLSLQNGIKSASLIYNSKFTIKNPEGNEKGEAL